jgi:hypothetical protein
MIGVANPLDLFRRTSLKKCALGEDEPGSGRYCPTVRAS